MSIDLKGNKGREIGIKGIWVKKRKENAFKNANNDYILYVFIMAFSCHQEAVIEY